MIMHPPVLALYVGSLLVSMLLVYASLQGVTILRKWDLKSGSELQVRLERKTYLISTLMSYAFVFELFSLFLFIYSLDNLSSLFVGAMCAVGTFSAGSYGYVVLLLKVLNFVLGGIWLIANYVDNQSSDYPLIRKKYGFLLLITPLVLAEAVIQGEFFFSLQPDIIASCCGTLFGGEGVASDFASLPRIPVGIVFYGWFGLVLLAGLYCCLSGKGSTLFSLASLIAFVVSIVAMVSFISPYIYELPTHHCPFCVLKGEYGYVGYFLYAALLGGTVFAGGAGWIGLFGKKPAIERRLVIYALISYGFFLGLTTWRVMVSQLRY